MAAQPLQSKHANVTHNTHNQGCLEHQGAGCCRAERFKRDALESKHNIHETRKTARELTRLEVNADHGKYGELPYGNYVAASCLSSTVA